LETHWALYILGFEVLVWRVAQNGLVIIIGFFTCLISLMLLAICVNRWNKYFFGALQRKKASAWAAVTHEARCKIQEHSAPHWLLCGLMPRLWRA
jgi:hypothetical protein